MSRRGRGHGGGKMGIVCVSLATTSPWSVVNAMLRNEVRDSGFSLIG